MTSKPIGKAAVAVKAIKKQEKKYLFTAEQCLRETFSSIVMNDNQYSIDCDRARLVREKSSQPPSDNPFNVYIDNLKAGLLDLRSERVEALKVTDNRSATISGIRKQFNDRFRGVVEAAKVSISKEASKMELSAIVDATGIEDVAEDITRGAHGVKNVVVRIDDDFVEGYSKQTNRQVPKLLLQK